MDQAQDRKQLLFLAETSGHIERYDDLINYLEVAMKEFPDHELSKHERNLLACGFKNIITNPRISLRLLQKALSKKENSEAIPFLLSYKREVEMELFEICERVITMVERELKNPQITLSPEATVFYLKSKADFLRYKTECQSGILFIESARDAHQTYSRATKIAKQSMSPTDDAALGLALNYAVFFYDILHDYNSACIVAKDAYDSAHEKLSELTAEEFAISASIMQLIKSNVQMWCTDRSIDWKDRKRVVYSFEEYIKWNKNLLQCNGNGPANSADSGSTTPPSPPRSMDSSPMELSVVDFCAPPDPHTDEGADENNGQLSNHHIAV
jgi:hypothetical protein